MLSPDFISRKKNSLSANTTKQKYLSHVPKGDGRKRWTEVAMGIALFKIVMFVYVLHAKSVKKPKFASNYKH